MKLEQTRKSTGPVGDIIWWYTDGFGHDDLKIVKVPASHNPSGGPAYYDAYGIGRSFHGFKTKAEALAWLVGAEMKPAPTLAVKNQPIDGYWFAASDRLPHHDGRRVVIGKAHSVKGKIVLCKNGLHASRHPFDALTYITGPYLYKVLCSGDIVEDTDKLACRRRKYIAVRDALPMLLAYSRECAFSVLHLWDAPDVVKDFLATGNNASAAAECRCVYYAAHTTARAAVDAAYGAARVAAAAYAAARAAVDAAYGAADAAMLANAAAYGAAYGAADAAMLANAAAYAAADAAPLELRGRFAALVDALFAEEPK